MTLPHPHGDSSGQIAHNSNYDTGVTPGSTGGKFVGFGEEGTSAIVNRANWALSENINYLHTQLTQEIAIPYSYSRTAGAGETSFQFPTGEEVWVGDSSYPGSAGSSDAEGMMMLFSVLDDNHNELKDDNGNEIRVKIVRESTGVTDVYQGGSPFLDSFQDQPIVYFVAVDPTEGTVVTDPYTIPSGTDYRVLCGVKSSVLELPSDAFVRYKVQAATEVEAGDTANFAEAQAVLTSNRCADKTGSITLSGDDLTYPDLKVILGGKMVYIPGGTTTIPSVDDTYYLYVTPAGVLQLTNDTGWGTSSPPAGSVVLWRGDRAGGTWTPTDGYDIRWPSTKSGEHICIYVGSGVGTDFVSLNDAVWWASRAYAGMEHLNFSYEFVIVGETEVTETVHLPSGSTVRGHGLLGDGNPDSVIRTSSSFDESTYVINGNTRCTIKNVEIRWGASLAQDNGSGLRLDAGSVVDGVSFSRTTTSFLNNVEIYRDALSTTTDTIIRNCFFDEYTNAGIKAAGKVRMRIEHCRFVAQTAAAYNIDLDSTGASGDATSPSHIVSGCFFDSYTATANIRVGGPNILIDSCHATLTGASTPFITISGTGSPDRAGFVMRNCLLEAAYQVVACAVNDSSLVLSVCMEDCVISDPTNSVFYFNCTATGVNSSVKVSNCKITGHSGGYIGYFKKADVSFLSNYVVSAGTGLFLESSAARIEGNDISCTGTGPCVSVGTGAVLHFARNTLVYNGATDDTVGIFLDEYAGRSVIDGNYIGGDNDDAAVAVEIKASSCTVCNNYFYQWSEYFIHVGNSGGLVDRTHIKNNTFTDGCVKTVTVDTVTDIAAAAIFIDGLGTTNVSISGNIFDAVTGSGVRYHPSTSAGNLLISDNLFDTVRGMYLVDNFGSPDRGKNAVIYVGDGDCTISGNRFNACGYTYTSGQTGIIENHAILLQTNSPVHITGNSFTGSRASARTDVLDAYTEIANWYADLVCSNNSFYKDVSQASSTPYAGYYQLTANNGAVVTVSGCMFTLTGTPTITPASPFKCVDIANGSVFASGCYTLGDWVQTGSTLLWDLNSGGGDACSYGSVVGCVFAGNRDVDIKQTGGFCVGNVHRRASSGAAGTMTLGDWPTVATYSSLSGSSPRAEFNRTLDTL